MPACAISFPSRDGVRSSEIYSIREARNGDLLIGARGGLIRMHEGRFNMYVPPDPLARLNIFDVLEDSPGGITLVEHDPGRETGLTDRIEERTHAILRLLALRRRLGGRGPGRRGEHDRRVEDMVTG